SPADVLRMLTADAAQILGVADRVGTLAAGKDADFVVLSGEPFALHTRVRAVYVEGQPAYESARGGKAAKVVRAGRILTGPGEGHGPPGRRDHGAALRRRRPDRPGARLQARRQAAAAGRPGGPALRRPRQPHRRRAATALGPPGRPGLRRLLDQVPDRPRRV